MKVRYDPASDRSMLRSAAVVLIALAVVACYSARVGSTESGTAGAEGTVPVATLDISSPGNDDGDQNGPISPKELRAILRTQAAKPRFDGEILGWRIATHDVLEAEGSHPRGLTRSCEGRAAGPETHTAFDFTLGYVPPQVTIGPVEGPFKSLCGDDPVSVLVVYNLDTPLGAGQIWVERSLQSAPTLELDVPFDSVESGDINGTPAIICHPDHDETGFGVGRVVIIEDDTGLEFKVLSIIADNGVPFEELIKLAEGIR